MNAHLLLTVLLSLLRVPAAQRNCIDAHRDAIERQADDASRATGVPVVVLIVVGWMESALGCDPMSGGCWGAPASRAHRLTAGNAGHAATALAWGYQRCGTAEGAIAHFRYGLCHTPARHNSGYTPAQAMHLINRIIAAVGGMP